MGLFRIFIGVMAALVIIYFGASIFQYYHQQQIDAHKQFCSSWLNRLNNSGNYSMGDAEIAQHNAEINQYNHECYQSD